jgi:NADPH2:quinone reductase
MRAVVVQRHGGPEVLQQSEVDSPTLGPGQLLVKVAAAGVNFMDVYQREAVGRYAMPPPFTPGAEGAGTVVGCGAGVADFATGDRVAWASGPGSYAEEVLINANQAVAVPPEVELETAAAMMLQGMTAHYLALSTYPIQPQDFVVVHAAAGGVGLLLTQIAAMRGATIIATTSTPEKAEVASRAGAHHVSDYQTFDSVVKEITAHAGARAVYDGVGKTTFDQSLASVAPRGHLIVYGAASGQVAPFDVQRLASSGSVYLSRPLLGDYIATRDELLRRATDLFGWIASGKLKVSIGGRYELGDASQAHRDLQQRRTSGKLLLIP